MRTTNRRTFLKTAAAGTGAAIITVPRHADAAVDTPRVVYRPLGSTGYKTSIIGFGAMNMRDEELLHAAIDMGINYVDTAYVYMDGVNERVVGKVMETKRDKVFLTTKALTDDPKKVGGQITESLKRLRTDHVDMLLFHVVNSKKQTLDERFLKEFEAAKKKGQTRFIGVSTHQNQAEVLDAATESKVWESVLVGYNYTSPQEVTDAIARARKAGLAIIGMKNLLNPQSWPWKPLADPRGKNEKNITAAQAMIKWVLRNPNVDVTIPGMTSFEQLAEDVAIMGMKMSFFHRRTLTRYADALDGSYCRGVAGCTGCAGQCPYGVDVRNLNRCLGYAVGYGDTRLARENYDRLPSSSRLDACGNCGECTVKCVNGLDLAHTIQRAKELFA